MTLNNIKMYLLQILKYWIVKEFYYDDELTNLKKKSSNEFVLITGVSLILMD